MASNIVPMNQARRPAGMAERIKQGAAVNRNFADNVVDSFPRLSIKGRVFRLKMNGQEQPLVDPQTRKPLTELDVVLVNASPLLSKSFYLKDYEQGDNFAPDCWSLDSIKPDPSVRAKQHDVCPTCQWNQFGSAKSRDPQGGKRGGKRCQDSRRVALVMPGQLGNAAGVDPVVFMLKVPQQSLKNLKAYAELLDRRGWDQAACVTKLSFEWQEDISYPKLTFEFVDGLSDPEYKEVAELAESQKIKDMLMAPDFDTAVGAEQHTANKVMEPRKRQATPDIGEPVSESQNQSVETTETIQHDPAEQPKAREKAKPQSVESTVIELPDGQLFDRATGEYIQRAKPEVEMPQRDPDVVELPDGRFYNPSLNAYVTGPEVGAKPKLDTELPKRRGRPKGVPNKPKVVEPEPETQVEEQAEPETTQSTAEVPQESEAVDNTPPADVSPENGTAPASASMEALLKAVLPERK